MSSSATVSVVIPAYNSARFIAQAVESARSQTYPVSEIIVVDDGSTDDSRAALGPLIEHVKYIRVENGGAARARNVGVKAATGELIAFLDADDIWHADKTARQVRRFHAGDDVALVYCNKELIDAQGAPIGPFDQARFPEGRILPEMLDANYISTCSVVLMRRDVYLQLGGLREEREFRNCEDYELWMRVAARFNLGAVPEALVKYRVHDSNLTRSAAGRYVGMLAALESAEQDLVREHWLDDRLRAILRARRVRTHEQFAHAFLFAREYSLARTAARRFLQLASGRRPPLMQAIPYLPDWVLDFGRTLKRSLRGAN